MLEKMSEMIKDQLSHDGEITLETKFEEDLGADSLDIFELITTLEDEYDIEIDAEELSDVKTVGQMVDYLKTKGIE
ncbi:acyl carrier protein [Eubacterium oxidoreducens]|uniref:Acyl carrier protein n=1 Tax=Eubacterium oxidoreducens TaxID=1732 RepID=A0A1G6BFA3_EUBOX|nr:acyl carrier protein [Eubacterium oxidoreducens]SDB19301.1 acyl carrier protein [Eubacterium oxidoreducens]